MAQIEPIVPDPAEISFEVHYDPGGGETLRVMAVTAALEGMLKGCVAQALREVAQSLVSSHGMHHIGIHAAAGRLNRKADELDPQSPSRPHGTD